LCKTHCCAPLQYTLCIKNYLHQIRNPLCHTLRRRTALRLYEYALCVKIICIESETLCVILCGDVLLCSSTICVLYFLHRMLKTVMSSLCGDALLYASTDMRYALCVKNASTPLSVTIRNLCNSESQINALSFSYSFHNLQKSFLLNLLVRCKMLFPDWLR
jgi:hypothetical protein